jgi:hypothetical protein
VLECWSAEFEKKGWDAEQRELLVSLKLEAWRELFVGKMKTPQAFKKSTRTLMGMICERRRARSGIP